MSTLATEVNVDINLMIMYIMYFDELFLTCVEPRQASLAFVSWTHPSFRRSMNDLSTERRYSYRLLSTPYPSAKFQSRTCLKSV